MDTDETEEIPQELYSPLRHTERPLEKEPFAVFMGNGKIVRMFFFDSDS